MNYTIFIASIVLSALFIGCDVGRGEDIVPQFDPSRETARDIEMLYSDSAVVRFRIVSPLLEKYEEDGMLVEEFTEGLRVDFFDENKHVISNVYANYALRKGAEGSMFLRDSVVIISEKGDKLETSSLTWDEANKKISTKKFIRLIVGESKDTLYGTGFTANSDFTNFAISTFSGRRKYANLSEEFGSDD
jgi:hypothetical protein